MRERESERVRERESERARERQIIREGVIPCLNGGVKVFDRINRKKVLLSFSEIVRV